MRLPDEFSLASLSGGFAEECVELRSRILGGQQFLPMLIPLLREEEPRKIGNLALLLLRQRLADADDFLSGDGRSCWRPRTRARSSTPSFANRWPRVARSHWM